VAKDYKKNPAAIDALSPRAVHRDAKKNGPRAGRSPASTGTTTSRASTSTWLSGEPLFASVDKFDSGNRLAELQLAYSGSRTDPTNVCSKKRDLSHLMIRTEVRSCPR